METQAAGGKGGGGGDTRPVATGAADPDEPFEIRGAMYEAAVLLSAARTTVTSVSLAASIDAWLGVGRTT